MASRIGPAFPNTAMPPTADMEVMEAGVPKGPLAGMLQGAAKNITPEMMKLLKDEMFKRYMARFAVEANPTPIAEQAAALGKAGSRLAGFGLPAWLGGGPRDIELPNETGMRDPRLGPGSVLDRLKMSRDMLKKLTK